MPKVTTQKSRPALPVMSQREVEELKGKIDQDQKFLEQAQGTPSDSDLPEAHLPVAQVIELDVDAVRTRIKRNKAALDAMDPARRTMTGAERQRGEKRYAELSEILPPRMLTREEMDYFPSPGDALKDQAYRQAVEKACSKDGENDPSFVKLAMEWKTLGRLLWPEDPEKSDVDMLRKHGPTSGRHFVGARR